MLIDSTFIHSVYSILTPMQGIFMVCSNMYLLRKHKGKHYQYMKNFHENGKVMVDCAPLCQYS